jgi:hypothetical protein
MVDDGWWMMEEIRNPKVLEDSHQNKFKIRKGKVRNKGRRGRMVDGEW